MNVRLLPESKKHGSDTHTAASTQNPKENEYTLRATLTDVWPSNFAHQRRADRSEVLYVEHQFCRDISSYHAFHASMRIRRQPSGSLLHRNCVKIPLARPKPTHKCMARRCRSTLSRTTPFVSMSDGWILVSLDDPVIALCIHTPSFQVTGLARPTPLRHADCRRAAGTHFNK